MTTHFSSIDLDDDPNTYESTVSDNGIFLQCIPERHRTVELCQLAITQNYDAVEFIPEAILDKVVTEEICWNMLKGNVLHFSYIPDQFKTSEMCDYALKGSPWNISHIPAPTEEQLFYAVRNDGEGIGFSELKPEYQSYELCVAALETDWLNLSGVKHQTFGLCLMALQQTDLVYSDIRNPLFKLLLLPVFLRSYRKSAKKDYVAMCENFYPYIKHSLSVRLDMFFKRLICKYL